ncbi:hypothetical protein GQ600_9700 [Phytophthora cactorum]|nr:hypothetical protein GQ600_9700 [Phytophthora cactorum]
MRQHNLLVLLAVAFVACVAVADDTAKSIIVKTVSEPKLRAGRHLKSEGDSSDPATEERGLNFKLPSFNGIKSLFSRTSNVGAGMKTNPELATTLGSRKVKEVISDVAKKPGFFQSLANTLTGNRKMNTLASQLRKNPVQYTSRQVTNVGHLAVTTSSSGSLARMWVKYGAAFLFIVGIVFLATMVIKATT